MSVEQNLKKVKKNTYVLIDECTGETINYKLIRSFLDGESGNNEQILRKLSKEGMVIVNTLTTNNTTGPNLICIDAKRFASMSKDDEHIHLLEKSDIIERRNAEKTIQDGNIDQLPAGDITIWNPNKDKVMGLMFSNSAPTITIKSSNGMVGMGVLRRQYITKDFLEKLQNVMGGEISIEVVSSAMGKYPTAKDGTRLLQDASDDTREYSLPEYIKDVCDQIGITCNIEDCYDINDDKNPFFKAGEKKNLKLKDGSIIETLANTAIVFDPSDSLAPIEKEGPKEKADDYIIGER